MQIKSVPSINFLYFHAETSIGELASFLPVSQQLYREAVQCKMAIAGALQLHYAGFTGDVTKRFNIEIALPVDGFPDEYDGIFHTKRTEPFTCVIRMHEGAWAELRSTYQQMLDFVAANNLQALDISREVYIHVDFRKQENNLTLVQVGIAKY